MAIRYDPFIYALNEADAMQHNWLNLFDSQEHAMIINPTSPPFNYGAQSKYPSMQNFHQEFWRQPHMLMVRVLPGASNKFRTGNKLIPARDRARVRRARANEHIHKWHLMNNTTIIKPRSSGSVMEIPSNAFSSVDIAKAAIKKLSDFLASKAGSHLVERRVRRAMSLPSLPSSIE